MIDILGIKSIFRFLVGGGDVFRSGRWLILVDFLVGRERRFYMSEFKHLLGGERRRFYPWLHHLGKSATWI